MATAAFQGYLGGRIGGAWDTEAGYVLARMRNLMGQAYDPDQMADWKQIKPGRRVVLDQVAQNLIDCARV